MFGVVNVTWETVESIKMNHKSTRVLATIKLSDGTSLRSELLNFYEQTLDTDLGLVRLPKTSKLNSVSVTIVGETREVVFFKGRVGKRYVFGQFESSDTALDPENDEYFLRRLPTTVTTTTAIYAQVVGGSCGSRKKIKFTLNDPALAYFKSGTQAAWQPIDAEVVHGNVMKIPNKLWTGASSNFGWILSRSNSIRQDSPPDTYANSYGPNFGWDFCDGQRIRGHEVVTLSYSF
eukprot:TRINITY_DN51461_c0_g1_i1.p1 TRINITY_DN51461_c0_g1~~TRINITY_DN51461_c0_g1_i1.p1  ORF type:complete len:234 (-),score=15.78 TRINITY_DN51461_c0_g1_i1:101-802(-)